MAHIGACPEDGPGGADLEATAILDPSKLPFGLSGMSNPTAEKLRQVFNTMAIKAADAKAAAELDKAPARMARPAPIIEDEQTEDEYPESWTGPRPDRDDFGPGQAGSPDIELDYSGGEAGSRGATRRAAGLPPAERPFAAVGVVPGAGHGLPPSSRQPPSGSFARGPGPGAGQGGAPPSYRPAVASAAPPASLRDPRLEPKPKSSAGLVVALVMRPDSELRSTQDVASDGSGTQVQQHV